MSGKPFYLIIFIVIISFMTNSKAQDNKNKHERTFGCGVGIGIGSMSVGEKSSSNLGLSLNGRIGRRFLLMVELNPRNVNNPVIDESFNAYNVILSISFFEPIKLRPGLGLQFRTWSGSKKVALSDTGPLFSFDVSFEILKSDKYSLAIEIYCRSSIIEFEGSVSSSFTGLQVVALM
jgi:hypothetical protein